MEREKQIEKAAEEYSNYGMGQSGFIAGAQWQAKQSLWISVEELLPETNGGQSLCEVLIRFDDGTHYVVANTDVEPMSKVGGVTHWMEIP